MTAKQIAVKRYVVKLSDEERGRLDTLIHAGKHPARLLTKARILLKADASEAGEGWSDRQIAAALDTSVSTPSRSYCRIQPLQLHAGVGGGELPIGLDVVVVSALLPCGDFLDQGLLIGNAAIETLAG